jgi:uncharacterized protein
MLIEIDKLSKEGQRISKDFDFLGLDLVEEDAVFLVPTHAEMVIKKVGEEIWIKGEIKARLSFVCSRCLAPFEFPVNSRFDLVYLPEELDLMKDELEEDNVNQLFFYSRQIDVREVVLEQLNLTFPMKPLCSADCQGICAVCGKVIKDGECACLVRESDPRLSKLINFLRDKR